MITRWLLSIKWGFVTLLRDVQGILRIAIFPQKDNYIDASGVTRTRNSKRSLDDWADTLGLPSDVPGKYGRKGATTAKNGGATATGTPGILVATAAQLTDPSGKITRSPTMSETWCKGNYAHGNACGQCSRCTT